MKRIGISLCLLAASALLAEARDDLKNCMDYAISHSTKIRIQQASVGDAQIALHMTPSSRLTPQVSGGSRHYNFGRTVDPQTNTYTNTTSFHNGYELRAGFDLFNGFEAVNKLRITKPRSPWGRRRRNRWKPTSAADGSLLQPRYFTLLAETMPPVETARQMVLKAQRQKRSAERPWTWCRWRPNWRTRNMNTKTANLGIARS